MRGCGLGLGFRLASPHETTVAILGNLGLRIDDFVLEIFDECVVHVVLTLQRPIGHAASTA